MAFSVEGSADMMSAEINNEKDKRPVMGTCYGVHGMHMMNGMRMIYVFKDNWDSTL